MSSPTQRFDSTLNGGIFGERGDFTASYLSRGYTVPRYTYLLSRQHVPENIALFSFLIGLALGIGLATAVYSPSIRQLGIYIVALAFFHIMEYMMTALANPNKLSIDAFLIHNGISYHIAHGAGIAEFLIEWYFFSNLKKTGWLIYIGFTLIVIGQTARSLAMWHAKSSFSHQIAYQKRSDHELVTTGIYSISRHPSYSGFFYWAVGTQILLCNPICCIGFAVVLYRFFKDRIRDEEQLLIQFFGNDYVAFRERTSVLIPFIR